jgi:GNAT superfamily N-acetyltransferase
MNSVRAKAQIAPATPADVAEITTMIRELAVYEKLLHEAKASEDDIRRALFDTPPAAHALMARVDGAVVGFSLYFLTFSTFVGRQGIWLEDLYVRPDWRKQGIGGQLLARLARITLERGCRRLEWSVLNWNTPSIEVYKAIGARAKDEWTTMRLAGEELETLAAKAVR